MGWCWGRCDRVHIPAGATGSLEDGAAAVSVFVGVGTCVVVPTWFDDSVLLLAGSEADGSFFLREKMAFSLSMTSSAVREGLSVLISLMGIVCGIVQARIGYLDLYCIK